ncbi:uncharacterized protein MELLADRAFT_111524 [Melampsora larici-populina 98AG31]|uniref:Uncharacterized protein n=1 Tax=Melampsora larici-populina (strain 98AG31 / pathotype 3-4-7) TaxID=747676 RepID=F4S3G8_MELLP|nr:uncharacterized protein MELLADRAFT_111524 [Melampsora larici-populina 98AG31]EGG00810.1 hypothetical protein MELLADRAFT_111524 [Melampsora larici-populina 98AG31]
MFNCVQQGKDRITVANFAQSQPENSIMKFQTIIIAVVLLGYYEASGAPMLSQVTHPMMTDVPSSHIANQSSGLKIPFIQQNMEERVNHAQQLSKQAEKEFGNTPKNTITDVAQTNDINLAKEIKVTFHPLDEGDQSAEEIKHGKSDFHCFVDFLIRMGTLWKIAVAGGFKR